MDKQTARMERNGVRARATFVDYVPGLGFGCWSAWGEDNHLGYHHTKAEAINRCVDFLEHGR